MSAVAAPHAGDCNGFCTPVIIGDNKRFENTALPLQSLSTVEPNFPLNRGWSVVVGWWYSSSRLLSGEWCHVKRVILELQERRCIRLLECKSPLVLVRSCILDDPAFSVILHLTTYVNPGSKQLLDFEPR